MDRGNIRDCPYKAVVTKLDLELSVDESTGIGRSRGAWQRVGVSGRCGSSVATARRRVAQQFLCLIPLELIFPMD
jgi:hypothetical protein